MNTIKDHWIGVKDARAELIASGAVLELTRDADGNVDGVVYLMSQKRRKLGVEGGRVSVNTLTVAALMIAQDSHRAATQEEIEQWQTEQAAARQRILSAQAQSQQKFALDLGPIANALIASAQATASALPPVAQQPVAPVVSPTRK